MPPDDSTPLGDAMTHRFPQQKIPEPEPGSAEARAREQASDISKRPGLPEHPHAMPADNGDAGPLQAEQRAHQGRLPAKQRG